MEVEGQTQEFRATSSVDIDRGVMVRISGVAEVLSDRALLEEIWEANALLRTYLGTIDNPELIVYRVRPERVRFMREWSLDYHEVPVEG